MACTLKILEKRFGAFSLYIRWGVKPPSKNVSVTYEWREYGKTWSKPILTSRNDGTIYGLFKGKRYEIRAKASCSNKYSTYVFTFPGGLDGSSSHAVSSSNRPATVSSSIAPVVIPNSTCEFTASVSNIGRTSVRVNFRYGNIVLKPPQTVKGVYVYITKFGDDKIISEQSLGGFDYTYFTGLKSNTIYRVVATMENCITPVTRTLYFTTKK